MDKNVTEELGVVEPVTEETVGVDSVTEEPKRAKKQKALVKKCKVLYWNKYSRNFAFQFDDKNIQITLPVPLKKCGDVVNVKYTDGKYEIVER